MMEVCWWTSPLPWAVLLFPACSGILQQQWCSQLTPELHPPLTGRGTGLARRKGGQQRLWMKEKGTEPSSHPHG